MSGGRRLKLTEEQAAEVKRRYLLWRENAPKRIRADFGIDDGTMRAYVLGRHKTRRTANT